jgi:DNA-binding winged helix-turn-helix (wHTH) protein
MTRQTKRFCDFGPFRLDRQRRSLTRGAETLPLPPKAYDVLLFLIEHPGRVVQKSEFLHAVWPDTFVEEGNLSQNIFLLRKTLGDGQEGQRFILTVPGVGYRFAPDVAEHDEPIPVGSAVQTGQSAAEQRLAPAQRRPATIRIAIYATTFALALAVGFALYRHRNAAPQALRETQLTTNAAEASLTAAAISPDGKYLAFSTTTASTYVRPLAVKLTHSPFPAQRKSTGSPGIRMGASFSPLPSLPKRRLRAFGQSRCSLATSASCARMRRSQSPRRMVPKSFSPRN